VSQPLAQVASMALPVVVVPLREGLALSYSELGVVLASFGVARLVMDLPAGTLVQRFNPRRILLLGLAFTLLSSAIGSFADSAWQVGLARALHGGSSSVVQTAILAWLVGRESHASRGRVMALSEALFSVVSLAIPVAVGLLAILLSWRAAFVLGLAGPLAAAVVVLLWTRSESAAAATGRSRAEHATDQRGDGWGSLRAGGALLVLALLVTFLVFFSRQGLSTLLPLIGGEQIGLSPFEVGLASSLLSAVSIGAILAGGWLGDRVGRRRLVVPGILAMLVGQLGLFLIADKVGYFTLAAILGAGFMLSYLPVSLVADALPPAARPRGIGVYRLVADGAVLLAPLMVGVSVQLRGFDASKLAFVLLTGAILLGSIWLGLKDKAIRQQSPRAFDRASQGQNAAE
jgi:MFS family permease